MKASELRIGNWVYNPLIVSGQQEHFRKVDYLDIRDHAERIIIQPFEPIHITEEWLKKFGFEENRGFKSFRIHLSPLIKWSCRTFLVVATKTCYSVGEAWIDLITERGENDYPELQSHMIPCQYVHQLQNLYFALSGEELTEKQP